MHNVRQLLASTCGVSRAHGKRSADPRLDFASSVLQYEGCLGTSLVHACEAGRADMVRLLLKPSVSGLAAHVPSCLRVPACPPGLTVYELEDSAHILW